MKLSEAIDRLELGETVWVKARVDRINNEGKYIRVMPNTSFVYLDGNDEISLTESDADKVEVTEKQAELLRAFKGESIHELLTNCLVEDEELMAKAHLYGYTVKPKRWVVKRLDCGANDMRLSYFLHGTVDPVWALNGNPMVFTDRAKAEAVAVLVEGRVEEVEQGTLFEEGEG